MDEITHSGNCKFVIFIHTQSLHNTTFKIALQNPRNGQQTPFTCKERKSVSVESICVCWASLGQSYEPIVSYC